MMLSIPLTGTVLVEGSVHGAGALVGDDNDPIRPVDIDLGNVSWTMVDVDLENEVMIIEVEPGETVEEPDIDESGKQKVDDEGNPVYKPRPATKEEKIGFLQHAQRLVMEHTKDELYKMSGCHRLRRPFRRRDEHTS